MLAYYPIQDPRNPEHEQMRQRVVRKIDWHVLPSVSLLYLACFLDRSNIGNAKIAGLGNDLDLTGIRFNTCLAVFYVTYIAVELPSNHFSRRFGAKTWLPLLVCGWGTTTILAAFVKNFASLVGIRLVLGFFEGGLLPGIILYLSTLYSKKELQLRIGMFFSCAALSGAFGGLLAYAIEGMDGIAGKPSWAWIFIIEGFGTLLVAVFARFSLFSGPASAPFLSPAEKHFAENRLIFDNVSWSPSQGLAYESNVVELVSSESVENPKVSNPHPTMTSDTREVEQFEWAEVRRGILEPQAWMTGIALLLATMGTYSYSFFLPTLVKAMGHDRVHSQLLSAYPYLPASVLVIVVAFLADRWQIRGPLALALLPLTVAGYLMAIIAESPRVRYASVFLMSAGVSPSTPCLFALLSNNTGGMTKRATVTALQIMISNLAGILCPWLYTQDQAPRFVKGHTAVVVFVCASWCLVACNVLYCWKENNARKAGRRDYLVERYYIEQNEKKTQAPIGDRDPAFLFTL